MTRSDEDTSDRVKSGKVGSYQIMLEKVMSGRVRSC